ncbi:MAG: hypothetical protein NTV43_13470 [Methylococcales bacterium]|nr:hypothetical protein [Methylococcales bacterium]
MPRPIFLLLIALMGGLYQNQEAINAWLNPPPPKPARVPGDDKVTLYSTVWCGYCAKTRRYFADNDIAYEDIDVEHTGAGQAAYQKLGANGVPIIVINDTVIQGYSPDKIDAALSSE